MTGVQLNKFIEKNLDPKTGSKISFINKENEEIIELYIYNKTSKSFDWILAFKKDSEGKVDFIITSGFSGKAYRIDAEVKPDSFDYYKNLFLQKDSEYMSILENKINSIKVDESGN